MEFGAIIKHNQNKAPKTGSWRYMKPEVDREKCIGCSTCVPYCPEATIEMVDKKPASTRGEHSSTRGGAEIDYEYCKGCGVCAQVCPVKAILMKKN